MVEFQISFANEVVLGSSPVAVMPDFPEDISIAGIYVNILLIYVGYKVLWNETTKWKNNDLKSFLSEKLLSFEYKKKS